MPTFQKTALIDAAETAIAAAEKARAEYVAACDKAVLKAQTEELEKNTPRLRALRDFLTKSLKTGALPTYEAACKAAGVRERYSSSMAELFATTDFDSVRRHVKRPGGWLNESTVDEYRGMVKVLKSMAEDTISTSALKTMGFVKLEPLFSVAARAGALTS
ncbi:hypothetical protein TPA2_gp59 [Tsukamurella phage TPA2]|uniref:hypothetical protein n=1 Tax=Tsukamurella phage TPA2 TaxID=981330 RepID=UPI0001FF8DD2|nr:hypothetical protein TPA2_gp59 [Tsukamurella phage TPA2]ADX31973.1 hypothetical protein [Tsukamurella phage TPA2]